jgi:hypothetical protein
MYVCGWGGEVTPRPLSLKLSLSLNVLSLFF